MPSIYKPSHPSVTIWFGGDFLPTTEEVSIYRLQFTHPPLHPVPQALSGNAKPALLSPVVALKLNQAERRHSSPYHAISISMRSGGVHATSSDRELAAQTQRFMYCVKSSSTLGCFVDSLSSLCFSSIVAV